MDHPPPPMALSSKVFSLRLFDLTDGLWRIYWILRGQDHVTNPSHKKDLAR